MSQRTRPRPTPCFQFESANMLALNLSCTTSVLVPARSLRKPTSVMRDARMLVKTSLGLLYQKCGIGHTTLEAYRRHGEHLFEHIIV